MNFVGLRLECSVPEDLEKLNKVKGLLQQCLGDVTSHMFSLHDSSAVQFSIVGVVATHNTPRILVVGEISDDEFHPRTSSHMEKWAIDLAQSWQALRGQLPDKDTRKVMCASVGFSTRILHDAYLSLSAEPEQ